MGFQAPQKIPVMDFFNEKLKPCSSSWLPGCNEVRRALEEYGCFVIRYDKLSSDLQNATFNALEELFDLPLETKLQNKYDKPFHGYVGQLPFIAIYEGLGIDNAATLEGTRSFTSLMWPNGNDPFCENVYMFSKIQEQLCQMVIRMIFESYGVGKYCESYIESTAYLLRLMKYREPNEGESNAGFVAHTDKGFVTILHQNKINGLEVQTKEGEWVDVELPLSSFMVFAGDAAMAWSNGRIHSPKHRVVMRSNITRYSLGLFAFFQKMIEIPEEVVDDEHPPRFKAFDNLGFLRYFHTAEGSKAEQSDKAINAYCAI